MIKEIDTQEKLKYDFTFFVNFVHQKIYNTPFIWETPQKKIVTELKNAYELKLEFLCINVPPRMGKTTLLCYWIAWTNSISESTYNNYYSGSDTLATKAYKLVEKVMKIQEVEELHNYSFKREKDDYSNAVGGGLFSMTINGQTIGVGAGTKTNINDFNGAIVIDDPHKMNDSHVRRWNIIESMKSGVLSRKNNSRVPVILVMQRIHKLDATSYLLDFYSKELENGKGKHVKIPVWDGVNTISSSTYPVSVIEREMSRDNAYYWTQLMQEPKGLKGVFFKDDSFEKNSNVDADNCTMIISFDEENLSEPIVFLAFKRVGNNIAIIDYIEHEIDANDFFNSAYEFAKNNDVTDIIMPRKLVTPVVKSKFDNYNFEAVANVKNLKLETFYSVGLLGKWKILLNKENEFTPLIEELKDYPNSKREFTVTAVVKAIEYSMLEFDNSISKSL